MAKPRRADVLSCPVQFGVYDNDDRCHCSHDMAACDILSDRSIDHYDFLRGIGDGSHGEVYLGAVCIFLFL
jgi:hypothetical protein